MTNLFSLYKSKLPYLIPISLILGLVVLTKSEVFIINSGKLSSAVIIDLVLIIPLIHLFLIRNKPQPKITIVPFFILGIVVASNIIPTEHKALLDYVIYYLLPVVELTVFCIIVYKLNQLIKLFKSHRKSYDFFSALKLSAQEIIPVKMATSAATEISVIYYGFIKWKKQPLKYNEFSMSKGNGIIAVLGVIIFLIAIETFALHLILEKNYPILALVLGVISIYSAFQIWGMLKSLIHRKTELLDNKLHLKYGVISETIIQYDNISHIELNNKSLGEDSEIKKLSPFNELDSHCVIIHLKDNIVINSIYGFKKEAKSIAFYIGNKEYFVNQLKSKLIN